MQNTIEFDYRRAPFDTSVPNVLDYIYKALQENGYNPVNQIVGYLLSGDPAYIPRHKEARVLIQRMERDEIIEELVRCYLNEIKPG